MSEPARPDLEEMLSSGAAVVVATVDANGCVEITRGWGVALSRDGASYVEVCATAPAGSRTLANLESTAQVAITVVQPQTYSSMQLKGRSTSIRTLAPDDEARVAAHMEAFGAATRAVGVVSGESLMLGELRVIGVEVQARFDQTPGANAGRQIS